MSSVSGADFKRFYDSPIVWGSDATRAISSAETYVEGMELLVDGRQYGGDVPDIGDTSSVQLLSGEIYNSQPGCPNDFREAFAWWLRKQSKVSVVVEVDFARLVELDEFLTGIGGARL